VIPLSGSDRSTSRGGFPPRSSPDLTKADSQQFADAANTSNARGFLNALAADPKSSQLKMAFAQEGISLTDDSDVGPGERFATLEEKAAYIDSRYTYTIETIFPSIVAYGWGFVVRADEMGFEQHNVFNSPAEREALQVDIPVAFGGSSSAVISGTGITVEQWMDLAESFLPPAKS